MNPSVQRGIRVVDIVLAAFAVAAGAMLAFQAVAVAADAIMRASGSPIRWVHEVTTYMLVGTSMLAAPYALRKGAHFRVTIFVDRLSPDAQRRLQVVLYLVAAVALAVFTYYSAQTVMTSLDRGIRAPTLLRTPLFIPQLAMPVGAGLLAVACIAETLDPHRAGTDPESLPAGADHA